MDNLFNSLKIPSRPAPPPPKVDGSNGSIKRSTTLGYALAKPPEKTSSRANRYIYQSVPRCRSTSDISGGHRKPPPRPPPPKLPPITTTNNNSQQKPQNIKIKLPGFKSRKKYQHNKPQYHFSTWRASTVTNKSHSLVGSLIDLQSPTHPPSSNSRSCSDDSSVDSFDSNSGGPSSTENQNDYCRAWSSSQIESGFEDDFDRLSTPSSSDPWSEPKSDPFSPQRRSVPVPLFRKFDISNDDPKMKPFALTSPVYSKPTVIRPMVSTLARKIPSPSNKYNDLCNRSPPMPTIPPPPPPPEALEVLAHGPPIPAKPTKNFEMSAEISMQPFCIALYDYDSEQTEDLSFKENEKIFIKRKVNDEWLEGEINGRTGIFPLCFVKIQVPILEENESNSMEPTTMIVLFDYHAQSWDDLELKEGVLIRVLGKVDDNWLYGEFNGKKGQFPANYVAEYLLN